MLSDNILFSDSLRNSDLPGADPQRLQHYLQQAESELLQLQTDRPDPANVQEQIQYYKTTLPYTIAKYLAAKQAIDILVFMPPPHLATRKEYLMNISAEAQQYRLCNHEAYLYFSLCKCDSDESHFHPYAPGGSFPTSIPVCLAPFLPLKEYSLQYCNFITGHIISNWINCHLLQNAPNDNPTSPIQWIGSIAAITELIYALNEAGVFGAGRQEINKLKLYFEKVFNVSIGNIYKAYEHARIRKKSRTPFIDSLKAALLRRMEEDDENAL
ncbi:RteC domain-containing protein [Chitinophaga sp. NPDC101104]|uniref:RteC domain-containing protein n=1 Tax=Chitinophaga sp. NPDC101104 TaxID=3390561 RepID=UPI003D002A22